MQGKMARRDPRPPFGLLEVTVAVRTSRLSYRKAGKTRIFSPSSGVIWRILVKIDTIARWRRCKRPAVLLRDVSETGLRPA
jgi:hypothetical protein